MIAISRLKIYIYINGIYLIFQMGLLFLLCGHIYSTLRRLFVYDRVLWEESN